MKRKPLGQPIGFSQGRPLSPYPPSSNMPAPAPFMSRPQGLPPGSGGSTFHNQAPPSPSGPGGLLQVLL